MDSILGKNQEKIDSISSNRTSVNIQKNSKNQKQTSQTINYQNNIKQNIIQTPNLSNTHKELQKRQRIENIKAFLQLKTKIKQLIELHKIDNAKETYHSLYKIYQELLPVVSNTQKKQFENSITEIYKSLNQALNDKRVKRSKTLSTDKDIIKSRDNIVRRIALTTDIDLVLQEIDEKGKISLAEIESQFNISRRIAEEWVQILSDANLVNIRYLPVGGIEITKV